MAPQVLTAVGEGTTAEVGEEGVEGEEGMLGTDIPHLGVHATTLHTTRLTWEKRMKW